MENSYHSRQHCKYKASSECGWASAERAESGTGPSRAKQAPSGVQAVNVSPKQSLIFIINLANKAPSVRGERAWVDELEFGSDLAR